MKLSAVAILILWAFSVQAADITVRIKGAPAEGVLTIQVYDSPSAFGDFRDPLKEIRTPVRDDAEYQVDGIPAGDIALLAYVDENENSLIDKNFIGIPKEPLGISNGYRPKGPPSFGRAAFTITEDESRTIEVELYRVLGERGRIGVGAGVIGRGSPYVGSNATVSKAIPAITYNGERLQWLGPTVQYGFVGTGRWRIAGVASYRLGVYEEDDSTALAGLGDREDTLMAGLGLRYELPGGVNMQLQYQHDVLDRIGGGTATASLTKAYQAGWARLSPRVQANWLSADIVNYDFGVPVAAATPTRPAYRAGDSVSIAVGFGSFIELTESWRVVLNLSLEFLPDEIAASPIVGDDRVLEGFAAITYVF